MFFIFYNRHNKHLLIRRVISLATFLSFFLSHFAYAVDMPAPDARTLAVNSIAEIVSEEASAHQLPGGEERAEYARKVFTVLAARILYDRIAKKARAAGIARRASTAGIKEEVIAQLVETGKKFGLPKSAIDKRIAIASAALGNEAPAALHGYIRPEDSRLSTSGAVTVPGYGISTVGPDIDKKKLRKFDTVAKTLMRKAKAFSIFSDGPIQTKSGDIILPYANSDPFFNALRARKEDLSGKYNIIVLRDEEAELPAQITFYSGYDTNEIVISERYLKSVSEMYALLDGSEKEQLVGIIMDAIRHSEQMQQYYLSTKGSVAQTFNWGDVEKASPTHQICSLFRIAYTSQKVDEITPNVTNFLHRINESGGTKSSYLYGFEHLDAEAHLMTAERLLERKPSSIDVLLAQHHLGAVFAKTEEGSNLYERAYSLLTSANLIDIDPDTGKPFIPEDFIEELVRLYSLIMRKRGYKTINAKLLDAQIEESVEEWRLGTQDKAGDSIYYPLRGERTALAVERSVVVARIEAIPDSMVSKTRKAAVIQTLVEEKAGETIIPRKALEEIGAPLMKQCSVSRSGAGKGTRYAEVAYDNQGVKQEFDIAKGSYRIPIDGLERPWRSILEVAIATMRGINARYGSKMPFDIYTSYGTFEGVAAELRRVGFKRTLSGVFGRTFAFAHRLGLSPRVIVTQLRKTSLFNKATGDFLRNVQPDLPWTEVYWPDAHDSTFFDFITGGRAYECVRDGYRFRSITNLENLVGMPSAVILAIMYLTNSPVIVEGLLNEGQPGGAFTKFQNGKVPPEIDFGHVKGILEADEFAPKVIRRLAKNPELITKYFPLYNGANYTVDIIQFMREAFMPEASDEAIVKRLKEFYDARRNKKLGTRLKHALTREYKRRTLRWEQHKGFDAVVPSTLAGTVTWLVGTSFLQIPSGPKSKKSTRYENLKRENYVNRIRERMFLLSLLRNNRGDTPLKGAVRLQYPVDKEKLIMLQELYGGNNPTLQETLDLIDKEIGEINSMYARAKERGYIIYGDEEASRQTTSGVKPSHYELRKDDEGVVIDGVSILRHTAEKKEKAKVLIIDPIDEKVIDQLKAAGNISFDVINPVAEPLTQGQLYRIAERVNDYTVIMPFVRLRIDARLMDALPRLRHIAHWSTGYNNTDLKAAEERGILVTNAPGPLTIAMAEITSGLMLDAYYRITDAVYTSRSRGAARSLKRLKSKRGVSERNISHILWGELLRRSLRLDTMYKFARSGNWVGAGVGENGTILHAQLGYDKDNNIAADTALGIITDDIRNDSVAQTVANLAHVYKIKTIYYTGRRRPEYVKRYGLVYIGSAQKLADTATYSIRTSGAIVSASETVIDIATLSVRRNFSYLLNYKNSLMGKNVSIAGMGRIGSAFAQRACAFGAHVIGFDTAGAVERHRQSPMEGLEDVEWITVNDPGDKEEVRLKKETLLRKADIFSILMNYDDSLENWMSNDEFDWLLHDQTGEQKQRVIFLNTSRGGFVDEESLIWHLLMSKALTARLDVIKDEVNNTAENPLVSGKTSEGYVLDSKVTGHTGSAIVEVRRKMEEVGKDNIGTFADGQEPSNVIDEQNYADITAKMTETGRQSTGGHKNERKPVSRASAAPVKGAAPAALPAVARSVRALTEGMYIRVVARNEGSIDLSKLAIVLNADLTKALSGELNTRADVLRRYYRVMEQRLSKVFNNGRGIRRVDGQKAMIEAINNLRSQGLKVVVLDNGQLTSTLNTAELNGVPGKDYAVIQAEALNNIDTLEQVPYVNLNAMAMMGVAKLTEPDGDVRLFGLAYRAFTGRAPSEDVIRQFISQARWIINVLPISIPYKGEISEQRHLADLFKQSV